MDCLPSVWPTSPDLVPAVVSSKVEEKEEGDNGAIHSKQVEPEDTTISSREQPSGKTSQSLLVPLKDIYLNQGSPLPDNQRGDIDGNESVVSELASDVLSSNIRGIVGNFVSVILDSIKYQRASAFISETTFKQVSTTLAKALRAYATKVAQDTPKTVHFRGRREVTKVISKFAFDIAREIAITRIPFDSDNHANTDVESDDPSHEAVDETDLIDRIFAWRRTVDTTLHTNAIQSSKENHGEETEEELELTSVDLREYRTIQQHLIGRVEFGSLCHEVERTMQHYCSDMMRSIQSNISGNMSAPIGSTTNDTEIRRHRLRFEAKCELRAFIESYGSEFVDLRHTLCITGNAYDAQLTSVGCYLNQVWPQDSECLIDKLQQAILESFDPKENGTLLRLL
jgi:hypothetical protein